MIVAPPASFIWGKAALDNKDGALRFATSVRSQPSMSSSSTVQDMSVPAAFTNTSMRSKASTVRSTACSERTWKPEKPSAGDQPSSGDVDDNRLPKWRSAASPCFRPGPSLIPFILCLC